VDLEVLDELFPMMCVGEGGSPFKTSINPPGEVAMMSADLLRTFKDWG